MNRVIKLYSIKVKEYNKALIKLKKLKKKLKGKKDNQATLRVVYEL